MGKITISIICHNHEHQLERLIRSIEYHCANIREKLKIIITYNIDNNNRIKSSILNIENIINSKLKGFSMNHNCALAQVNADYLCILNPDTEFTCNPFSQLIQVLENKKVGVVAPLITDSTGKIEDSARKFLSPWRLFKRVVLAKRQSDYPINKAIIKPDWVAGMFMLFRREVFQKIGGFDQKYFLYCEDIDICYRLRQAGYQVALNTAVTVIHDAQRTSHRSFKYLWLHIKSLLRFFMSHPKTLLS